MRRSLLARARPPTSCHSLVNRLTSLASPLPLCYMFVFFFIRDCLRVVRIRRPHRRLLLDATQRDLLPPPPRPGSPATGCRHLQLVPRSAIEAGGPGSDPSSHGSITSLKRAAVALQGPVGRGRPVFFFQSLPTASITPVRSPARCPLRLLVGLRIDFCFFCFVNYRQRYGFACSPRSVILFTAKIEFTQSGDTCQREKQ